MVGEYTHCMHGYYVHDSIVLFEHSYKYHVVHQARKVQVGCTYWSLIFTNN
jgi:hypothetical protein